MGIRFLTGNSFPLNLIRRPVRIEPETLDHYREQLRDKSYHDNVIIIRDFLQGTTNDFHAALLCIERIRNNFFSY